MRLAAAVATLTVALAAAACGGKTEPGPAPAPAPISLGPPPGAAPQERGLPAGHPPMPAGQGDDTVITAPAPSPHGGGGIAKERFRPAEGWQDEAPSSGMRLLQYRLPRADGDAADGEVAVFANIMGSTKANIERWRGQFREVAKGKDAVTEITEGVKGTVTLLDITGNYGGQMPGAPAEAHPGAPAAAAETRMIAAVVEAPAGTYYVKAMGPPGTMGKWEKSIRDFIIESAKK